MATQSQNAEPRDQNADDRRNVQRGPDRGYDAKADETLGDQTADESEELSDVLSQFQDHPKDQDLKAHNGPRNRGGHVDQPASEPGNAQRGQAHRGGA